jgi:hypothetical protein
MEQQSFSLSVSFGRTANRNRQRIFSETEHRDWIQ